MDDRFDGSRVSTWSGALGNTTLFSAFFVGKLFTKEITNGVPPGLLSNINSFSLRVYVPLASTEDYYFTMAIDRTARVMVCRFSFVVRHVRSNQYQ